MKQELIAAAGRAFLYVEERGHTWWGHKEVTTDEQYRYIRDSVLGDTDNGTFHDGDYSIWLLLIAAELAGEK